LIVLDTQVVMDWLVFKEPSIQPLVRCIEAKELRWIGVAAMKAELLHVLGRGIAASFAPDLGLIEAKFAQLCELRQQPAPAVHLRCRDSDDQVFIDLAVAEGARWLVSRDRAVLALRKRASRAAVEIVSPQAWIQQHQRQKQGAF
jgi:predicted nucleic acid-binding protein